MIHQNSGTSVPQSLDSSKEQQDFKQVNPRKSPILAISLRPFPGLGFEITIARRCKVPRVYTPSSMSVKLLVQAINNLRYQGQADVMPQTIGWTAYIWDAVYPPPKPFYPPYSNNPNVLIGKGVQS